MSDVITIGGVELPWDLEWPDRYTAWRIGQTVRTSVTGAIVIHEGTRQAGRRITLQSGSSGDTWWAVVGYETLAAVQALIDAGGTHTLTIPTADPHAPEVFTVRFDLDSDGPWARPVRHIVPPMPGDWWAITLKFIVVE